MVMVSFSVHYCIYCVQSSAMHREHKVIRLEWEAIHVNYSYLLDQMAPDEVLPYLAVRRLLTSEKVSQVQEKASQLQKTITILEALNGQVVVGMLPTFCAALASTAGQEHIAEKLIDCEFIKVCSVQYIIKKIIGHPCVTSCNTSQYEQNALSNEATGGCYVKLQANQAVECKSILCIKVILLPYSEEVQNHTYAYKTSCYSDEIYIFRLIV